MRQDQIDSSKDTSKLMEIDLSEFLTEGAPQLGSQLIDLNAQVSPAVLSGILGCNVAMVYQYRQDGKLPPNSDASYRDSFKHHVNFWKTKSAGKANNMAEAALVQKIQLDRARTEAQWLNIKKERGELVDTKILAEVFEPFFLNLRMQLCSMARKYPNMQQDIDSMLAEWQQLGTKMLEKSENELHEFIENELNKEVELEEGDTDEF
jgi:phage terminase Nu1 subunit (DNA packaging protein)